MGCTTEGTDSPAHRSPAALQPVDGVRLQRRQDSSQGGEIAEFPAALGVTGEVPVIGHTPGLSPRHSSFDSVTLCSCLVFNKIRSGHRDSKS